MLISLPVPVMSAGGGDELWFERLDSPEPPHRSVFALHQDVDGFLWIGTQDGLARFDGSEMRILRHDPKDLHSISNSSIHLLFEDRRGRFWVGTEDGLNILDRRRLKAVRVPTPGHPEGDGAWFYCAFEDREGRLWFGTDDGLLRFDGERSGFRLFQHEEGDPTTLTDPAVVGIQEDRAGCLWVATTSWNNQSLHRMTAQGEVAGRFPMTGPASRQYAFLIDSQDRFWTHPSGPMYFDPEGRAFTGRASISGCSEARSAIERVDGSIWIACDDGLYHSENDTPHMVGQRVVEASGTWLENYGRSLVEDSSGTLWVGTEGGLFRIDPHSKPFSSIVRDPANPYSLSADAVSAIAEAPEGELWVATYGGGLNRVDPATGRSRHYCVDPDRPDRCTSGVIWHLHTTQDGMLWIAGSQLWSVDPKDEKLTLRSPRGVIIDSIVFIAQGDDDMLWMGGLGGRLYRYTISTGDFEAIEFEFEHQHQGTDNRFDSLLLDGDTLWIGMGDALGVFDTTRGSFSKLRLETVEGMSLSSLGTWAIHRDPDGCLWLGTSIGLVHFSPEERRFGLLTTQDGLPGSSVYSILEDETGAFWLGTNRGLVRFDRSRTRDWRFRTFTTTDGTGNTEFNRHAALRTDDGSMYFGGMDGLTCFDPSRIHDNPFVPPIAITKIDVSSREGTRTIDSCGLDRLVLAPGDTTVRFQFAALNFTSPGLNRYRYHLEGFDSAWIDAGTRRTTQYTNIPPGTYRMRVSGSNNDGVWNEEGRSLEIVVQPAVWETWWFRVMVGALVLGVTWAGVRFRARRKHNMERLRLRIAGDLHDDLSSDLSGVAVLADMLCQTEGLGSSERADLGTIRDASLHMADGLRDIVWYIDPEHDSLEATVRRMKRVVSTLLRGISHEFVVDLPQRNVPLGVNARRNLFLILKEGVHNIVRHAEAENVEIVVAVSGGLLRLSIKDDGRGFDPAAASAGHGVGSMRRRAEEIDAEFEILSVPGRGTELCLTVGLAHSRDGGAGKFGVGWRR
jgi:ligand-binding sensor domain-containing protein